MYLSFYRLKHKPFQINTDPKFLWMGEKHEEALATLKYGVIDNKGFLLLTGDVGTGKTTLIHALLNSLDSETYVAFVRDPALEPLDFFQYVSYAFGMKSDTVSSKGGFLIQFERFLQEAYDKRRKVVLIIDEAQRINQNLLEEVRLLSNLERQESKLLNIFFIGQNEFNDILLKPENRAIRQRITVHYNIQPLTREETARYINHRLEVASEPQPDSFFAPLQKNKDGMMVRQSYRIPLPKSPIQIFSPEAVYEVFAFSGGCPRPINVICDRAMLTSFVEGSNTVLGRHVRECVEEMEIPESVSSTDAHSRKARYNGDEDIISAKTMADRTRKTTTAATSGKGAAERRVIKKSVGGQKHAKQPETEQGNEPSPPRRDEEEKAPLWPIDEVAPGVGSPSLMEGPVEPAKGYPLVKEAAETAEKRDDGKGGRGGRFVLLTVCLLVLVAVVYAEFDSPVGIRWREKVDGVISSMRETYFDADRAPGSKGARTAVGQDGQGQGREKADVSLENREAPLAAPTGANAVLPAEDRVDMDIEQLRELMKFRNIEVQFQSDSGLPDVETMEKLNALAEAVQNNAVVQISISYAGSAPANGAPAGERGTLRANMVKSYLMGKGVSEQRITVQKLEAGSPEFMAGSQGMPAGEKVEVSIVL